MTGTDLRARIDRLHGRANTLIISYSTVGQGNALAPEVHQRTLELLDADRASFEDALDAVTDAGVFDADQAAQFRDDVDQVCQWAQADSYARATGRARPARPDRDWRSHLRQPV